MCNALARSRTPARPRGAPETDPQRVIHTVQSGERDVSTLPDTLYRCLTAPRTARHGLSATLPTDWQYSPPAASAELYALCRRLLAVMRESWMATMLLLLLLLLIWS